MPTYDYHCDACDHEFEEFQAMLDKPLKKCPKCKKAGVKRLIGGGAGLIFKGTGFYITDYKNKKQPAEKSEGGGDKAAPAKTETKVEAKAEAKPAKPAAAAAK